MHDLSILEDRLGYKFEEPEYLRRALVHPSADGMEGFSREDVVHAQRLSWLGDSVLDMVVSDKLYSLFPMATKDRLHYLCVRLTNNKTLGRVAQEIGIEDAMVIGKSLSKNMGVNDRHKMLAGTLEAIFGAIFMDGGIRRARSVIRKALEKDFKRLLEHIEEE